MAYQSMTGSGIGTLLRQISEQRANVPFVAPSAQVGTPLRNMVQQPIYSNEAPGTQRVVSIKPEATTPEEQGVGPVGVTGATSFRNTPASPVSPVAPASSAITGATSFSNRPVPMPVPTPRPTGMSAPAAKASSTPSASRIGTYILGPTNTPIPSSGSGTSGKATVYKQTGSTVAHPTPGPTPTKNPSSNLPAVNFNQQQSLATKIINAMKQSPYQYLSGLLRK